MTPENQAGAIYICPRRYQPRMRYRRHNKRPICYGCAAYIRWPVTYPHHWLTFECGRCGDLTMDTKGNPRCGSCGQGAYERRG